MAFTLRSSSRLCSGPVASSQRRTSICRKARAVLSPLQVTKRSKLAVTTTPPAPRPRQRACSTNSSGNRSTSNRRISPLVSCIKGSRGNKSDSVIVMKHVRFQLDDIAATALAMEVGNISGVAASNAAAADCTSAAADCAVPSEPGSPDCDLGACWGPQQLGRALSQICAEAAKQAAAEPSHRRTTESHKLRTAGAVNAKASRAAQKRPQPMRF